MAETDFWGFCLCGLRKTLVGPLQKEGTFPLRHRNSTTAGHPVLQEHETWRLHAITNRLRVLWVLWSGAPNQGF